MAPILASGGLDMSVVVTPAALPASTITKIINPLSTSQSAIFEDSYHRRLAYNSGAFSASALHIAREARLLLCQRDAGVSIWRIKEKEKRSSEEEHDEGEPSAVGGWEPVLDMDLSVHTNIVASAISDDGHWIAVSDWYESKLFRIQRLVRQALPFDSNNSSDLNYSCSRKMVNSSPDEYATSRQSCKHTCLTRQTQPAHRALVSRPMARSSLWPAR